PGLLEVVPADDAAEVRAARGERVEPPGLVAVARDAVEPVPRDGSLARRERVVVLVITGRDPIAELRGDVEVLLEPTLRAADRLPRGREERALGHGVAVEERVDQRGAERRVRDAVPGVAGDEVE